MKDSLSSIYIPFLTELSLLILSPVHRVEMQPLNMLSALCAAVFFVTAAQASPIPCPDVSNPIRRCIFFSQTTDR